MLISVQLFMQGDALHPQIITDWIGINPTNSYAMGDEWVTGQGFVRSRSIGLWKWGVSEDRNDVDLNLIIKKFYTSLEHHAGKFTTLPGVERAWIDIFICKEMSCGVSADVAFNLTSESLRTLCGLGLPMEVTTSSVDAES